MPEMKTMIKRLLGNSDYKRDIELPYPDPGASPEEQARQRVERDRRRSEQTIDYLRRISENARRLQSQKKKK